MKKLLYLALVAMAAFGCSKVDVSQPDSIGNNVIEFDPYVGKITKVASTTNDNFLAFYVTGYQTSTGTFDWAAPTSIMSDDGSPVAMSAQGVTRTSSAADWTIMGKTYDWPAASTKLQFVAASENTSVSTDATNGPHLVYSNNTAVASQKDLLVASSDERLVEVGYNPAIELTFNHALSKVSFSVKCNTGYTVTINKIGIDGLDNGATYRFLQTNKWADWSYSAANDEFCVGLVVSASTTSLTDVTDEAMMVIPQVKSAWGTNPTTAVAFSGAAGNAGPARIVVEYKMQRDADNVWVVPYTGTEGWVTEYLPFAVNFEMGKAYRIELDMKQGGGYKDDGTLPTGSEPNIKFTTIPLGDWTEVTPSSPAAFN